MAENVPMNGFGVPPLPTTAQPSGNPQPPSAASMQPGFVTPPAAPAAAQPAAPAAAPAGATYTQAQVDAIIAASLGGAAAPAAPQVNPGAGITPPQLTAGASDPVLSSMTAMLTASAPGLDIDRAIGKALAYGDPALIDLAYMGEKGGANAQHLIVMAKALVERVQVQAAAGEQAVFAAAGGKDAWHAAAGVFDKNAPAHVKQVVKMMIDSGNASQMEAGAKMVVDFGKNSGLMPTAPGLVHAGAGGAGTAQALSREEFQTLHFKLNPNDRDYNLQRDQLLQRRQLGKSLGM